MSVAITNKPSDLQRNHAWKWMVCGLLLLATTINYMDRLTLNQMVQQIMNHFALNAREYGQLESAFGSAFAIGAIIFGWLVDRINVRWIYALAVLAWSLAGFSTGLAFSFASLLLCRFLLGVAEAGNWPCALRTTQHLLPPEKRTLGNSILQSGAAIGSVLTPLIVLPFLKVPNGWRYPFMLVGTLGIFWLFMWLGLVKTRDLERRHTTTAAALLPVVALLVFLLGIDVAVHWFYMDTTSGPVLAASTLGLLTSPGTGTLAAASALTPGRGDASWVPLLVKASVTLTGVGGVVLWLWHVIRDDKELNRGLFFRRFWVLALVVVIINGTWHYFRVWLPLFLQRVHSYSETDTLQFSAAYYFATDLGALTTGFVTLRLASRGLSVFGSRMVTFTSCALLCATSVVAAYLPAGPLLLAVFLVVGFAALGMFPNYYSFSQDLTVRHQGKLTGALGCICWLMMSLLHEVVGDSIVRTGSYSTGVAAAGLAPLVAAGALILFWGKTVVSTEPPGMVAPLGTEDDFSPKLNGEAIQPSAAVGVQK